MPGVTTVDEHFFPGGEFDVAVLAVRVDDLARGLGLEIRTWNEDGLGAARGVLCRLPSGRVMMVRELVHAVEYLGARGPDVIADGDDILAVGANALVEEILAAFELPRGVVGWMMDGEGERFVAETLVNRRTSRRDLPASSMGRHDPPHPSRNTGDPLDRKR